MTTQHDPRDLLARLPLVKDVKPWHLHARGSSEPLVAIYGDFDSARPVDVGVHLSGAALVPVSRLRRLLQRWPAGEPVTLDRDSEPVMERRGRELVEVGRRPVLVLYSERFRVRLRGVTDVTWRPENATRRGWSRTWRSAEVTP